MGIKSGRFGGKFSVFFGEKPAPGIKKLKKGQKISEKGLTKGSGCDKITELGRVDDPADFFTTGEVARVERDRTLKIKQYDKANKTLVKRQEVAFKVTSARERALQRIEV